jgi:CPA1 family monovalent cation:H+ antiporter
MHLSLMIGIFALMLIVISFVQPLADRAKVSASVLLAVIGIVVGFASQVLISVHVSPVVDEFAALLVAPPVDSHLILSIFLPVLLFQTALNMDFRDLANDAAPIFSMAVIAVVAATCMIGLFLWPFADLPLVACLMLGAIVATTDPVAVVGIFRDVGAPARLGRLVEGESLLNDAAAITLFTMFMGLLLAKDEFHLGSTLLAFLQSFGGGLVLGVVIARITSAFLPIVRDYRPAQVSLSLALPYLVFVLGEHVFEVSGVVAVVAAGLTFAIMGPSRIRPHDWAYLRDIWEQIEFWASSFIFVLAALLVPKLLVQVRPHDFLLLGLVVAGALISRALVLYGLFPILSLSRLSQKVSFSFKAVMLWGGLRGAITLALALAVTENSMISPEVKHFVAVLATGFVLFTLLVYGTTLRGLVHLLKLDRLSPFDVALQAQVLANTQIDLNDRKNELARRYGVDPSVADDVFTDDTIDARRAWLDAAENVELADRERLTLGLVALARRERQLLQDIFRNRIISPEVATRLIRDASRLTDQTRMQGRIGYIRQSRKVLEVSPRMRLALLLYRYFHSDNYLAHLLSQQFEALTVQRIVVQQLQDFVRNRIGTVLGERVSDLLLDILKGRRTVMDKALASLQEQYPDYARTLERRILGQAVIRMEEIEYARVYEDSLIGLDLYNTLLRRTAAQRRQFATLPKLDLGLDPHDMIRRVPLFESLTDEQRHLIAGLLQPRFAVPNEVLVRKGERGKEMFFIAAGSVKVTVGGREFPLGRGEFFGEFALLSRTRRQADVVATAYSRLLILKGVALERLIERYPEIGDSIREVAARRHAQNQE